MKQMRIVDFMNTRMLQDAIAIYESAPHNLHHRLLTEVVEPNMAEINRKLGQENDARYIAYAIEYALSRASR